MLASPLILLTLASMLLFGGLVQPPIDTGQPCPPHGEVSPEDAAQAEAVVRDLIAALSAGAAPGADASAVTAAEAAVNELMGSMVSFEGVPGSPPPALAAIAYLWLPHPTDPNTPLTVGEPLELIGLPPMDGRTQIALTVEVSNGSETRTLQFWLLREGSAWRVEMSVPVALDPAGCYVIAPPEVVGAPVVVTGGPVVVTGSPIAVGEGELPPDAPPLGDPSEQLPPEPTGPIGLHVVNADGSGLTSLAPTFGVAAWSPDGARIAVSRFGPEAPPDIAVINADGTGETLLAATPRWDLSPAWSPDGTRIAFLSQIDVHVALYVVNADGSGLTELADAEQAFLSEFPSPPAWAPDGSMIAFVGPGEPDDAGPRSSPTSDVWVVRADGSDLRQVTDLPGAVAGPIWSPDGTRLAFTHELFGDMGAWSTALYVVNPDGTGLTALTGLELSPGLEQDATRPAVPDPDATAVRSAPTWSPDGTSLAFVSNWGLGVIGEDGGELAVHPVGDLYVSEPVWSPDGSQIAFSGVDINEEWDIYLINPDGSDLMQLAGTDWFDGGITWSPDGSQLAFTATPPLGD